MTHIIYHKSCNDGFCCAYLLSKLFPDAEYIAAQYGDQLPDLPDNAEIVIADFSYPRDVLESLGKHCHF